MSDQTNSSNEQEIRHIPELVPLDEKDQQQNNSQGEIQSAAQGTPTNTRVNPYEVADVSSVPKRARHLSLSSHAAAVGHTRSRTLQSARDAAAQINNQERIVRLDASLPSITPVQQRQPAHAAPRVQQAAPQTQQVAPQAQQVQRPAQTPTAQPQQAAAAPAPQAAPQPQPAQQPQPQPAQQPTPAAQPVQPMAAASGYTPYATASGYENRANGAGAIRTRRTRRLAPIIAGVVFVVVAFAATLFWLNRPVTVTVNGATTEVRVGSTLKEVLQGQNLVVNPGNYVTVGGDVISPNMGYTFSASVNGELVDPEAIDDFHVEGGEAIELGDGADKIEEHTATTETIKPYLRMEGSGYELQYISQWPEEGILEHRVGKESGQKADVVTKEKKDCIVTCRDLTIEGDQKYVALTFDDGPADPYTAQYLDILDKYGVKATFYNLGANIELYPELAKRIVDSGHQLSNHTMDHNQLTADSADEVYKQIQRSADVIEKNTGVATTHIRPPYGDFSEKSWLASKGSITAAVRWSGDSEDWKLEGAASIVEKSCAGVHSGTIILMHDGGGERSQDVEALPILIERLQAEGYTFVTVSDLMRAAGDIPEDICSGTGTMPEDCVWPDEIDPEDIAAAEAAAS